MKLSKIQLSKTRQLGGFNPFKAKITNGFVIKVQNLTSKFPHDKLDKLVKSANPFNKKIPNYDNIGSGITLTNNERKHIIKVIRSLKNRGVSLKKTIKKVASQKGGFLDVIRPLMTAELPLMKNVVTRSAKSVFIPLGLTIAMSVAALARDGGIQKKISGSGTTALIILNEEN